MAGNVLIAPGEISSHQRKFSRSFGENDPLTVPLHPLRIRPTGNAYTATENIKPAAGAFAALPDELLIQILESLDAASLKRLGCTCKALYAFSRLEDLWKTLCIEYELPLPAFLFAIPFATTATLDFARSWDLSIFRSSRQFFKAQEANSFKP